MKFGVILIIVCLIGEFEYIPAQVLKSKVQLADDTPLKKEQISHALAKLTKQISYRLTVEEKARAEAQKRIDKFESHTQTLYTHTKPLEGKEAKKLWEKAKKASDKYIEIKSSFNHDQFCQPPLTDHICERALQNPYFKQENLSFDTSKSSNGYVCSRIEMTLQRLDATANIAVEYKMCFAIKTNADDTQSSVTLYLQSAYKQPLMGGMKFFVLFKYNQDPETEEWQMMSDPVIQPATSRYRYEAYLTLS